MALLIYDFCFDRINHGFYWLEHTPEHLRAVARFKLGDQLVINPFSLRLKEERVSAYRHGEKAWVDFSKMPADHYPSSAYPLLLPQVGETPFTYIAIEEGDGRVAGETSLRWVGKQILEERQGQVLRRFTMDKDSSIPVAIDWGGPVSYLCADAKAAVADSGVEFVLPAGWGDGQTSL